MTIAVPLPVTLRVLDMREIAPRVRHTIVAQLFEHLAPGTALELKVDHNPMPLRRQFEMSYGAACRWTYLERGPDLWRVRLERNAPVPGTPGPAA
ncbi:MAG: DUF2249 domain-containing protein [Xanthobacteraceae bacterium]